MSRVSMRSSGGKPPTMDSVASGLRSEEDRLAFQRGGDMADGRPDDIVEARSPGDAAREVEELVGAVDDCALRVDLGAQASGKVPGEDRGDEEKAKGQHLALARDLEGEARFGEEEVVREESEPGRGD